MRELQYSGLGFMFFVLLVCVQLVSCKKPGSIDIPIPQKMEYGHEQFQLSREEYKDRVLGALVGSAIGDAMGASTEMWNRNDITQSYGYITGLTPAVRPKSPEGTWRHNLGDGASTDDTRWKYLISRYILEMGDQSGPSDFAGFISSYYRNLAGELKNSKIESDPDQIGPSMEKINWILEWARVSMAYEEGPVSYNNALHRFYGGEMACAGILYTPVFGLMGGSAESAYQMAYDHAIFDLGYARDISGLVAAMTRMAMNTDNMDSILNVTVFVDPMDYEESRLIGRLARTMAEEARDLVKSNNNGGGSDSPHVPVPKSYPGDQEDWDQVQSIYRGLEQLQMKIPFHAGEIWQISCAAMEYGAGDFEKTLQFIVNYGRDNDTVAALVGMILGARLGYSALPFDWKKKVVEVTRDVMGINLEELADEYVSKMYSTET